LRLGVVHQHRPVAIISRCDRWRDGHAAEALIIRGGRRQPAKSRSGCVRPPGIDEGVRRFVLAGVVHDYGKTPVGGAGSAAVQMGYIGQKQAAVVTGPNQGQHAGVARQARRIAAQRNCALRGADRRRSRIGGPSISQRVGCLVEAGIGHDDGESASRGAGGAAVHVRHVGRKQTAIIARTHQSQDVGISRQARRVAPERDSALRRADARRSRIGRPGVSNGLGRLVLGGIGDDDGESPIRRAGRPSIDMGDIGPEHTAIVAGLYLRSHTAIGR